MSETTFTGLKTKRLSIPAYEVGAVDFTNPCPNYFRVQNKGGGTVYCSTVGIPTTDLYDFTVKASKISMYSQPFPCGRLYIYNPSGTAVEIVCTYFAADFDPLAMALSELEIDMPSTIESNMVVTGFNASLPIGSNVIGKVGLNGSIPAGSNKIGSVSVENLATLATLAKQEEILSKINEAIDKLTAISTGSGQYMDYVSAWGGSGNNGETAVCTGGTCHILMLTNDGDGDFNIILTSEDGTTTSTMALKPGETINDLKFRGTVKLDGTNYAFRIMAYYM